MLEIVLHLDQHLSTLLSSLGPWTLLALVAVIFCETGLVFTPFLPGDSLLFATGALSALSPAELPIQRVLVALFLAATLGDFVNCELGRIVSKPVSAWLERRPGGAEQLATARAFFEKHGGRAVVLARFLPILRTLVPFVAGASNMKRRSFLAFNVVGAAVWVGSLTLLGYFLGNLPAVKSRFHWVIAGILVLSIMPAVWEGIMAWRKSRRPRVV